MLFSGREQWVGLDNIYALTNRPNVPMQLRISMENMAMESFEIGTVSAYYDTFRLEDQVKKHPFIHKENVNQNKNIFDEHYLLK